VEIPYKPTAKACEIAAAPAKDLSPGPPKLPAHIDENKMSDPFIFQITLMKKSHHKWTRRTFKLQEQTLFYFDNDQKLKGEISLSGSSIATLSEEKHHSNSFLFVIKTAHDQEIILKANTEEDRQQCLQFFNRAAISLQDSLEANGNNKSGEGVNSVYALDEGCCSPP
jgi:hypothetical protein